MWGAQPRAANATALALPAAADAMRAAAAGTNASGNATEPGLPAGITCEPTSNGQGQNCGCAWRGVQGRTSDGCVWEITGLLDNSLVHVHTPCRSPPSLFPLAPACSLVAVYCCQGEEDVTPYIPDEWPPPVPVNSRALTPGVEAQSVPQPQAPGSSSSSSEPGAGAGAPPPGGSSGGGQKGSSSMGMVAGIAGGLGGAAAVAVGLALLLRRRRRRRQQVQNGKAALLGPGEAAGAEAAERGSEGGKDSTPRSASANGIAGGRHAHFGLPGQDSAFKAANGRHGALSEVVVPGALPLWGPPGSGACRQCSSGRMLSSTCIHCVLLC